MSPRRRTDDPGGRVRPGVRIPPDAPGATPPGVIAEQLVGESAVGVEPRVTRSEEDGLLEVGQCALVVSLAAVGDAALSPRDDEAGLERQRSVEVADGTLVLAHLEVGDASRSEGAGVARAVVAADPGDEDETSQNGQYQGPPGPAIGEWGGRDV